ncbi:MAG: hypothetical protein OXP08_02380, partial [bacterium]|nr:hypothetical protein [bacterium]
YASVSVGSAHACGLLAGGEVACWGDAGDAPPGGAFTAVSAGTDFACGLRPGGEVVCWGSDAHWRASPPPGRFASISAAGGFACGLRADGEAVCWGDENASAYRCRHSKAWVLSDSDRCRSDGRGGGVTPPGPFASVAAAEGYACGLRDGGEVVCWGDDRGEPSLVPPALPGPVAEITAHGGTLCALRGDGSVDCLDGGGRWPDNDPWAPVAPSGAFTSVAAGHLHACGIRPDQTVECWSPRWPPGAGVPDARFGEPPLIVEAPDGDSGAPSPVARGVPWRLEWVLEGPQGRFDALSVEADVTCGRRLEGRVECWEPTVYYNAESALDDRVLAADAAYWSSCFVHTDWAGCGSLERFRGLSIEGAFVDVGVGHLFACALGAGGDAVCWGANQHGQSSPNPPPWIPGPPYRALAVGHSHACALRAGGDALCWGDDRWGQTDAPPDSMVAISAGHRHTCGLRSDGEAVCWGDDLHGQTRSPKGAFTALGAGQWHTCGLRVDGEVVCWGDGFYGGGRYTDFFIDPPADAPTEPPAGPFSSLAVGEWHSCALRPDGTAACWLSYGPQTGDTEAGDMLTAETVGCLECVEEDGEMEP